MAFDTGPAKPAADVKNVAPRGISEKSRSATYKKRGLWAIKKKHGGEFPKQEKSTAKADTETPSKAPKYYPADDTKTPKKRNMVRRPARLRKAITPGTVLILLAGRFKGKRVVFVKQLDSGLLLITGPYAVNGVPLRRVNQAYVIATSTKIDIGSVDSSKLADKHFTAEQKKKSKQSQEDFFGKDSEPQKKEISPEFKEAQDAVDGKVSAALDEDLKAYLGSRFSLRSADRPHLMKF